MPLLAFLGVKLEVLVHMLLRNINLLETSHTLWRSVTETQDKVASSMQIVVDDP